VKLDHVRCDSGLAVEEVEEGDACDAGAGTDPSDRPRRRHLPAPLRRCAAGAERRRSLGESQAAALMASA
jgi:hypothetical protein